MGLTLNWVIKNRIKIRLDSGGSKLELVVGSCEYRN